MANFVRPFNEWVTECVASNRHDFNGDKDTPPEIFSFHFDLRLDQTRLGTSLSCNASGQAGLTSLYGRSLIPIWDSQ